MKVCITGHDEHGKAVFSYAGEPPNQPSPGSYDLWTTKGALRVPDATDPKAPASIGYFPVAGETSFRVVSVPPHSGEGLKTSDLPEEIRGHFDPEDASMHTTDTIDYVFIVSGAADLELDDGRKERVTGGDCVIQRGTRHAWRVVGDEPLVLCAILIGAERSG